MKNISMSFSDAPTVGGQKPHFEFFLTYERDNGEVRYIRCLVADEGSGRITPESFAGFMIQAAEAVRKDARNQPHRLTLVQDGSRWGV